MARDFNGTNQFLNAAQSAIQDPPFTVSLWVNSDVLGNNEDFFEIRDTGVGQFWVLRKTSANTVQWHAEGSLGSTDATSAGTIAATTWTHCGAVEASTTDHRVFLSGVRGNSTALADPSTSATMNRMQIATSALFFNGKIGHVALWNAALTDAEMATLSAGVSALNVRRSSLITYWPMNGQSPEPDVVGGIAMTLNNAPTRFTEPRPLLGHSMVAPG